MRMAMWRLKKGEEHSVKTVGDLKKALVGVPDNMRIETTLDNSAVEPLECGVYVNDEDPADRYFGIAL
jgi:hypothetical protein